MAEEQEADFSKLSIEDRCQHKNWKARVSGYEDLINVFQTQTDDKSPEFNKYSPLVKKLVVDSNAAAQEKGLAAVLTFVENYAHAGKQVEAIVGGIVTKCLISPKMKTKELALEVILMFVEIEKQDLVIEELIKGLDNKTPKIVAACVSLLRECIKAFGAKVINLKPILKTIPRLLEDRDKNIREEGKALAVEIYRWIKEAIKPQLNNLKPIQLQELDAAFEKEKAEKPTPSRYLRSQQQKVLQEVGGETEGETGTVEVAAAQDEAIDPFELLEPVDILAKLPKDFYEMCEAKKWQERKEMLENLQKLLEDNPKLQPGDFGELVKQLKKMVSKDTNVVVVAVAAKNLALVAKGLRKLFSPFANSCISIILEKFKEKKTNVIQGLREAIDAIFVATNYEAILEDLTNALDNKNPQIKCETALFLVRSFSISHPTIIGNKKLLKPLCDALLKTLNDMDSAVRDAAAQAIGTAMKVVGEKTITPFIQGVDAIKMAKIKEFCDKAEVKIVAPPPPAQPAKSTAVKRPVVVPKVASSPSSSRSGSVEELDVQKKVQPKKVPAKAVPKTVNSLTRLAKPSEDEPTKSTAKPVIRGKNSRTSLSAPAQKTKKEEETSTSPLIPVNKLKDQRLADEKALRVLKWNFTSPREEFYVQLKEQMQSAEWHPNLITNCFHSDFKFHIKAIDSLREFLLADHFDATLANVDLILKWIALRFFDTNPSVILKALEYLIAIFDAYQQNSAILTEAEANSFIPYLVLKSGDPKDAVRNKVHEIIKRLSQIFPPVKMFNFLMVGLQSKNARQRATCLDELAGLIEDCGMSVCQPQPSLVVKEISKFIADRDNSVRNAALNCVVQVYYLEGEKVYKFVGQLNDKELSLLEERIKRSAKSRVNQIQPPQTAPAALPSKRTPEKNGRTRTPSPPFHEPTPQRIASASKATPRRPKSMGMVNTNDHEYAEQIYVSGQSKNRKSYTITPSRSHQIQMQLQENDYVEPHQPDEYENMETHEEMIDNQHLAVKSPFTTTGSMSKLINSSPKAEVAINLVMAQLSSQDIFSALEAFSQLAVVLEQGERGLSFLEPIVDQIIIMSYMQYRLFTTKHLADESMDKMKTDAIDLFRGVTQVLLSLFKKPTLAKSVKRDVLRELMSHLISLLVDGKVMLLEDCSNIIRSLNNLAALVIANAEPTSIISALIKLLHDCTAGSINASQKFTDMVMKCLWKISKKLDGQLIDQMDVDRIFLDIHLYFKTFPKDWFVRNQHSDIPLRTLKTITFIIVQHKKQAVFEHLKLIQDHEQSELYHYLKKALKQSDRMAPKPPAPATGDLPQLPEAANLKPSDIISWYKSVAHSLGLDASKYNDKEFVHSLVNGAPLTEEEARRTLQRAQDTLDNFKRLSLQSTADHNSNA